MKLTSHKTFKKSDLLPIGICAIGLVYYTLKEPMLMLVLAIALCSTFGVVSFINLLDSALIGKLPIKTWHVLAIALGVTLCFVGMETPSHALLFDALETAMGDVTAATGGAVPDDVITALFTFFRVVVILAFVGGAILGVVQALQGSDWRPIANMMGIGVGLVLAIEVLTNLIVGTA
ncbi:hypothetical protein [Myxosarcina sp. GI1]|uniref:hypothetical protein n=1 Tax=Myxosarcina sp. GI1 TaxID=1541065 RepID=UPI00068DAAD2|nr:hypothetical protein [Myxosarcina sp. GI1]